MAAAGWMSSTLREPEAPMLKAPFSFLKGAFLRRTFRGRSPESPNLSVLGVTGVTGEVDERTERLVVVELSEGCRGGRCDGELPVGRGSPEERASSFGLDDFA